MRRSDAAVLRLGAVMLVVMALIMAAAFNLSKFPGFRGTTYQAWFSDASGLRAGNMVQVGGIRSGRVQDLELREDRVLVTFEVDNGIELGDTTQASVEVLNLLGEKYLQVDPAGEGELDRAAPIPLERTQASYDIVGVFGDLTRTTEQIDKERLVEALDVVSETVDEAAPQIQASFEGIARLSRAVSSRDEEVQALLASSTEVSTLLAERSEDLVALMGRSDKVFVELRKRKAAIHRLLVNARTLSEELRGLAEDNQAQLAPALAQLDDLLTFLVSKEEELQATLDAFGPYASILGNIIGTGPWFDAYVVNLASIPTGEFVPQPLEDR